MADTATPPRTLPLGKHTEQARIVAVWLMALSLAAVTAMAVILHPQARKGPPHPRTALIGLPPGGTDASEPALRYFLGNPYSRRWSMASFCDETSPFGRERYFAHSQSPDGSSWWAILTVDGPSVDVRAWRGDAYPYRSSYIPAPFGPGGHPPDSARHLQLQRDELAPLATAWRNPVLWGTQGAESGSRSLAGETVQLEACIDGTWAYRTYLEKPDNAPAGTALRKALMAILDRHAAPAE